MRRLCTIFPLTLLLASSGIACAAGQTSSKISPDLAAVSTSGNVQIIVQYYNPPSTGDTGLLGLLGGVLKLVLGPINALVEDLPLSNLNSLAADPNVKYMFSRQGARRKAGRFNAQCRIHY